MTEQKQHTAPVINDAHIEHLLTQMTLAEKVGQMTMVEKFSISPAQVAEFAIGALLSGGGGNPTPNDPQHWRAMVTSFEEAALQTRLGIPLIYGVDAVHGHSNVAGAVIFPHNIGLGAADDADLVERIGQITALEMLATGAQWTFAPSVAVPQDIRWGRTYEGFGERPDLASRLGAALVRGLQGGADPAVRTLACAKHYLADGGTAWGTKRLDPWTFPPQEGDHGFAHAARLAQQINSAAGQWQIDQGEAQISEAVLREIHLSPYQAAVEAGVMSVMVSYSSWGGLKMHAQRYLLTDVLKQELGFSGLIVSDWLAIDQIDPDFYTCVVKSINAGLDMIMVPYDYQRFITTLLQAVEQGDVSEARIDDAARRILRVKQAFGLFENPFGDAALLAQVGSQAHRDAAREAVRKSAVLLKNAGDLLPLPKTGMSMFAAGAAAEDIGVQCGGWSISWQGSSGAMTTGTTILAGLRQAVPDPAAIHYSPTGEFVPGLQTDVGIVVIGETPYAEGFGDRADLALSAEDIALLARARQHCRHLVVILLSGRPLILTAQLPLIDALVVAWLPGTEGQGVADVIFGDYPFSGKLPFSWPRSMQQVPLAALLADDEPPLFEFGWGL